MADIDIFALRRGSVTAPAGCGKTQLIADTLARHRGPKPILVLTHTNAGVAALRARMQRGRVPQSAFTLATLDGFTRSLVRSFPFRSGLDPQILKLENPKQDYAAMRAAAAKLLAAGHINEILDATYSNLIVDEYQDCSLSQHAIVDCIANVLPTCVLGDPMQAIFGIAGNQLVDWTSQVLPRFPYVCALQIPWRWRNAGTESFGHWLLKCRDILLNGGPIDLRTAPPELTWIRLSPATAYVQRARAASALSPLEGGTVLVIGDSKNASSRRRVASQTPGAINVEPADLADLVDFGRQFDLAATNVVARLVEFAGGVMTNVGAAELQKRVATLRKGKARKPPSSAEHAVVSFANEPSLARAAEAILSIKAAPGVRVYRPEMLRSCLAAIQTAVGGGCTLLEATERERDRCRHLGRTVARRAVGSTLLLKGLEADVAVLLQPELMDARHLYVALTRGARCVIVCSTDPILVPFVRSSQSRD